VGQVACMVKSEMGAGFGMENLTERFHLQGLGVERIHKK